MKPSFDILVIDDEPVVIAAVRKILLPEGLSVDDAPNTDVAFHKLGQTDYKVILCDLKLPGAGGWEVMRYARDRMPGTPVIMITGYATLDSTVESFKVGAYDFLPKPFDTDELVALTRRAIRYADLDDELKRVVDLDEIRGRQHGRRSGFSSLHALGGHSWAGLQADGTAEIGMGESFAGLAETIQHIDLPELDSDVRQAKPCGRIVTSDQLVCTVLAPLSGCIVQENHELELGTRCDAETIDRWWLMRIVPDDLEAELDNLTQR